MLGPERFKCRLRKTLMSGPSFLNLLKVQAPNIMNNTNSKLITEIHEAWAVANGYRKKATSNKPQAAKRQAPSAHTIKLQKFFEYPSN